MGVSLSCVIVICRSEIDFDILIVSIPRRLPLDRTKIDLKDSDNSIQTYNSISREVRSSSVLELPFDSDLH